MCQYLMIDNGLTVWANSLQNVTHMSLCFNHNHRKIGIVGFRFLVLPTYIKPTNLTIGTVSKLILSS